VEVDANFGKPMENAAQFKDMTATIKIGKKRAQTEMMTASVATTKTVEKWVKVNEQGERVEAKKEEEGNKVN
jgi:hypothetical protein